MTLQEAAKILQKLRALEYARVVGNIAETCRELEVRKIDPIVRTFWILNGLAIAPCPPFR